MTSSHSATPIVDSPTTVSTPSSVHVLFEVLSGLPASGLIELRMTDNAIEALPEAIGRLANLRELHLRNNRLVACK